jgi:hypothetical protein
MKQATIQQLLLDNGSANRRERNNSTAIALQQGNGVYYTVIVDNF